MKATRRGVLAGALAVPGLVGLSNAARAHSDQVFLLYDPGLEAGRRLAASHDGEVLAIAGDRIRFARAVFARRPAMVVGVSRRADALLIEEVAREAGYAPVTDPPGLGALGSAWVLAPRA